MRKHWGIGATLLVALAGCGGGTVEGTPESDGGDEPISSAVLGDARTLDPCSLVAPEGFASHGDARRVARESLDHCRVAVAVDRENVIVDYGLLLPEDAEGERPVTTLAGDVRVVATSAEGTRPCTLRVVLADETRIEVKADAQRSGSAMPSETVCAVARTAAEGIHTSLSSGAVEHWEPPTTSLARLSACGLLPAGEVADLVGTSSEVTLYPAEHQCTWGTPGGEQPNAQLDFTVGPKPDFANADRETVAGRDTMVHLAQTDSLSVCTLTTEHGPFAEAVDGEVELAVVRVLLTDGEADPCEHGIDLAEAAWEKLPAR